MARRKTKRCLGVLDGRNVGELDVRLRAQGVSDHDRHELLRFASILSLPDGVREAVLRANEAADTTDVDISGGERGAP